MLFSCSSSFVISSCPKGACYKWHPLSLHRMLIIKQLKTLDLVTNPLNAHFGTLFHYSYIGIMWYILSHCLRFHRNQNNSEHERVKSHIGNQYMSLYRLKKKSCTWHSFKNHFGNKHEFTKYFKESCGLGPEQQFLYKYWIKKYWKIKKIFF